MPLTGRSTSGDPLAKFRARFRPQGPYEGGSGRSRYQRIVAVALAALALCLSGPIQAGVPKVVYSEDYGSTW